MKLYQLVNGSIYVNNYYRMYKIADSNLSHVLARFILFHFTLLFISVFNFYTSVFFSLFCFIGWFYIKKRVGNWIIL